MDGTTKSIRGLYLAFWGLLGPFWASGLIFGPLGSFLVYFEALSDPSRAYSGPIMGVSGNFAPILGSRRPFWTHIWRLQARLGPILESGRPFEAF